jgi:hypothetical protein
MDHLQLVLNLDRRDRHFGLNPIASRFRLLSGKYVDFEVTVEYHKMRS